MDIEDVVNKLESLSDEIDIKIKRFDSGYWINPINGEWVTTRIYVSVKEGSDLPTKYLTKIIKRIYPKSIKSNIEIIEK